MNFNVEQATQKSGFHTRQASSTMAVGSLVKMSWTFRTAAGMPECHWCFYAWWYRQDIWQSFIRVPSVTFKMASPVSGILLGQLYPPQPTGPHSWLILGTELDIYVCVNCCVGFPHQQLETQKHQWSLCIYDAEFKILAAIIQPAVLHVVWGFVIFIHCP